jgi:ribosome maturation factor RimP
MGQAQAKHGLEALVEATLGGLGYELVDLETPQRGRLLRIFMARIGSGAVGGDITLSDCERVSKQLQNVLAVEGIDYERLEVSSPGLDRVLKKPRDFQRFAGAAVEARLRVPRDGRRKFTGMIRRAGETGFEIEAQGETVEVSWADLEKARLVPNLNRR